MAEIPVLFTEISTTFGIATAMVGVATFALKVRQDRLEFRRKQVDSARMLVTDLFENKPCMTALRMLDYSRAVYRDDERNTTFTLATADVLHGLRTRDLQRIAPVEVFVRDCYDALFAKLEQLSSSIEVRFIRWSDIESLVGYCVQLMRRDPAQLAVLRKYAVTYGFPRVWSLLGDDRAYPVRSSFGAVSNSG
jgi:hypothetical protein